MTMLGDKIAVESFRHELRVLITGYHKQGLCQVSYYLLHDECYLSESKHSLTTNLGTLMIVI